MKIIKFNRVAYIAGLPKDHCQRSQRSQTSSAVSLLSPVGNAYDSDSDDLFPSDSMGQQQYRNSQTTTYADEPPGYDQLLF